MLSQRLTVHLRRFYNVYRRRNCEEDSKTIGKFRKHATVLCARNFSVPISSKDKLDKNTEHDQDDEITEIREDVSIRKYEADAGKDTPEELQVKRKMSGMRTAYGKLMKEAEPEEEETILAHYVRKAQESLSATDENIEYDVIQADKKLFFRMVDIWIQEAGEVRRGHREFVQVVLNNVERFNVQHEPNAYLKILECYPQSSHTGMKRSLWFKAVWQDKILDHEIGVKIFSIMHKYGAVPNDKFYDVCSNLFGEFSRATATIRAMLYWYPRLTQFITFPVSNKELETMSRAEIAIHALRRTYPTLNADYRRFEVIESVDSDSAPIDSSDKLNCILSIQTRDQKELLENHDVTRPLFVEGPHVMYFKNQKVQYYVLRTDPIEKKILKTDTSRLLTDKEWWVKFYGKDYESSRTLDKKNQTLFPTESFLPTIDMDHTLSFRHKVTELNQINEVDEDVKTVEGRVYGIAATDLNSIEAMRSWIYGLESSNPVLNQLTILFNEKHTFLSEGYKARK